VLASVALSRRFLASLLYEVTPTDLPTLAVAAVLLGLPGWIASYIPARRAASIDPLATLRR
jgi:ABC-type lipoprotein release transport system permease subunit